MERKHFFRIIRRKFAYGGLRLSSLIAHAVREKDIYRCALVLGALGYRFAGKQRRIALENLALAFAKQKSDEEIVKIARDCFRFMAKSAFEVLYFMEHPEKFLDKVHIEGKEHLDRALAKGRGVLALSPHFGNFPLQQLLLGQMGYAVNSVIRHMRDQSADTFFLKKRSALGLKTIYTEPRQKSAFEILRALKNNETLFILMDQNYGTGGVFVDFFGTKAATATGPVVLGMRCRAALVPMFMVRNPDDTLRLIIEEELALEERADFDEAVLANVQKITTLFETYIRRYPPEWGWIHRRWKTRPKP